ncbi:MAG: Tol-Pal system beta propeller repeat protein TolB [Gammaproteobacteria bacterium]
MTLPRNPERRRTGFASIALCALLAAPAPRAADGELTIRIEQGIASALPIAIVPFATVGETAGIMDIAGVVRADLARSGQFATMPPEDMPSQPASFSAINFKDWRVLGMENLVIGKVLSAPDGGYVVEFRVVDVYRGKQLMGYRIPTSAANLRLTAHHVADMVYERLLNQKGAFATRIAYVTVERQSKDKSLYRLQVADADGFDPHTILESTQPLLSPAWSPDGNRIAYVSFEERNSSIYLQDIRTGKREKIVSGPGINSAPAFAPDGERLAVTLSRDGNPEIYLFSLASKSLTRLTNHPAIDTEASWSPDGRALVFTSDRGGGPQIYRLALDGSAPQRVTFDMGNYNARGRYSPDGRKLAMVHGGDGGYRIGVLDLATNSFELVTGARLDESPSFAPNGSMIIYATMGAAGTELAAVSTDGRLKQRLALQRGEVREPAWGPFRD